MPLFKFPNTPHFDPPPGFDHVPRLCTPKDWTANIAVNHSMHTPLNHVGEVITAKYTATNTLALIAHITGTGRSLHWQCWCWVSLNATYRKLKLKLCEQEIHFDSMTFNPFGCNVLMSILWFLYLILKDRVPPLLIVLGWWFTVRCLTLPIHLDDNDV